MSGDTERGRSPEEMERAFDAFVDEHPELADALGLWMVDADALKAVDPGAAAIFAEHFPELLDN